MQNRNIIGGWAAEQYGLQKGKHVEYIVEEVATQRGQKFHSVSFFRPYQKSDGTLGKGFGYSENQLKELVERINHYIQHYGREKGRFVFQHEQIGYGQPPQQPGWGQQPQQFAPQGQPSWPQQPLQHPSQWGNSPQTQPAPQPPVPTTPKPPQW